MDNDLILVIGVAWDSNYIRAKDGRGNSLIQLKIDFATFENERINPMKVLQVSAHALLL